MKVIYLVLLLLPILQEQDKQLDVPDVVNLGKFIGETERDIEIQNISESDIIILNIIPSCDCIQVEWKAKLLHPNEKQIIKLKASAEDYSSYKKDLYIVTNGKRKMTHIKIIGNQ